MISTTRDEVPVCSTTTVLVPHWYAIRVRPKHEFTSAKALSHKRLEEFVPKYRSRRRWSDRSKCVELPLFPGYVFCRFTAKDRLNVVSTPGVTGIVSIGTTPALIEDSEIAALMAASNSNVDAEPCPFLKVGATVRIVDGPLAGLSGILLQERDRRRIVLSVTLLQRSVAIEIDRAWILALPALSAAA